jgi:hypothetical protein
VATTIACTAVVSVRGGAGDRAHEAVKVVTSAKMQTELICLTSPP